MSRARNRAIKAHHRGDPVVNGVVARIAFPHCKFAYFGYLIGRLFCTPLQISRRLATDDFRQAGNSLCGLYDWVLIRFAQQDQGIEDLRIARTVGCFIKIIDT